MSIERQDVAGQHDDRAVQEPVCDQTESLPVDGPKNLSKTSQEDDESSIKTVSARHQGKRRSVIHNSHRRGRARKVISRSRGRVIGKFASMKMRATIYWESQLERDAITLFEVDPAVSAYFEQPLILEYRHNGEIHRYTPDLLVEADDNRFLIEVKPDAEADLPENQERFLLFKRLFLRHGYVFRVLPEREIRIQPRLTNIKILLRYRCIVVSKIAMERVRRLLADRPPLPIKWFSDHPDFAIGLPEIASLVCRGYLEINMNAPLGPDSMIQLSEIKGVTSK